MKHLFIQIDSDMLWGVFLTIVNLASLFSGGKDSIYAIFLAKKQGHHVNCLITVSPLSDESHLLHHPNLKWTSLQATSMNIPQLFFDSKSDDINSEVQALKNLLQKAKDDYCIEGVIHGGIKSHFQKEKFDQICKELEIISLSPLWQGNPNRYLKEMIGSGFNFIITSVSSNGLDDLWLGKQITLNDITILESLSKKFGFNLDFEGGEAETFVVNCPLFSRSLKIKKGKKYWDGYRGRFEIVEARID